MAQVLRRLYSPTQGEGQPTFFDVETVEPDASQDLKIERRLGGKPSHRSCRCPLSWTQMIWPVMDSSNNDGDRFRDGTVGFAVESKQVIATSKDQDWQQDIRDIGGGIADYEKLVAANKHDATRSMHWALWQSGVRFVESPLPVYQASQEPLPGLESPPLPLPNSPERQPDWLQLGGPVN